MSLKTCRYCNKQYEDNWSNWVSKYCCRECYIHKKKLYNINDIVYTYDNKKLPDKTMEAVLVKGIITKIYEVYRPTENGLWRYVIKIDITNRCKERFEHQIFLDSKEAVEFVRLTNERRIIMREANKLLKKL